MKKGMTWMLIVVLLLSMAAGCSGGTQQEGSKTEGSKAQQTSREEQSGPVEDKPIALSFLCQINVDTEGYDVNDNPYINYIREANHLDITVISESADYASKVMTVMSSGALPDYVQLTKALYFQFAEQGILLQLDEMLDESEYPHLMSGIGQEEWEYSKVNGGIYGVPFVRYDTTPYISYARKDWLDKLEIDPESLKTVEDYYNMLYAFTYGDPDGNGVDDTYGLSSCTGGNAMGSVAERYMGMLFQDAFDAAKIQVVDGEVLPNYVLDGYKDYLKFLARLYEDGIIVPDYITKTQKQTEEEFKNGKFGVLNLFWSLSGLNEMRDTLYPLAPPEKVDGSGQSKFVYQTPIRHYIGITEQCEHPEAVLALYDWSETDEGSVYVHAGVEGWDYDRVNGEIVIREERVGINWAWRFLTLGHQKSDVDEQLLPILTQSWGETAIVQLKLSENYGVNDAIYVASPVFAELADYDLDTYVAQYRDQAVMGQVDIDATWEKYVSDWRASGGDVWVKLYTDWYNSTQK